MKSLLSVRMWLLAVLLSNVSRTNTSAAEQLLNRAEACVREVERAQSRNDQIAAYSKFFAIMSHDDLQNLVNHKDISIAAFSRWSLRDVQSSGARLHSHPQRWLGFLEGRIGVPVPDVWAATLSCAPGPFQSQTAAIFAPAGLVRSQEFSWGSAGETTVTLPSPSRRTPLHRASCGLYLEMDHNVSARGGIVTFQAGEMSLRLPEQALKYAWHKHSGNNARCTFRFDRDHLFVAFYDASGHSYPLLCFDAKTRQLLWSAEVWALQDAQPQQWGTAPRDHRVDLVVGPNVVACFGIEGNTCYAEGFDSTTGHSTFWFVNESLDHYLHLP